MSGQCCEIKRATLAQRWANRWQQRWANEQSYVGPMSFANVGPMFLTTVGQRWANVIMLSGVLGSNSTGGKNFYFVILAFFACLTS